ncbi:MAG: c-type cytochrome [Pseudohongiellaceae bacterium]
MSKKIVTLSVISVFSAIILLWLFYPPIINVSDEVSSSDEEIEKGKYLVTAGGCISCHRGQTELTSETLAGGLGIETEFGTFYAPNITPDTSTGIGSWKAEDFIRALKHGRQPSGGFYYPSFPYRAYSKLSDEDVLSMAAYLMSQEPVSMQIPDPETPIWLARWMIAGWNKLADLSEPFNEIYDDAQLNRGAYLARNLGHCGECHTPRNGLGIPDYSREFAGAELGDEIIEPIDADSLKEWTANNFDIFLLLGLKPDGEFVGGDMNEVIEHNTSKLTDEDRDALAAFFTRHNSAGG